MRLSYPIIVCLLINSSLVAATIQVPAEQKTVQEAINMAIDGDTVLIAPGVYRENLKLHGKTITLASHFIKNQDQKFIAETILDGNEETVLNIADVGPATTIIGLTIQNGDDGIFVTSKINLFYNIIKKCEDGIDYEDFSGGLCRFNIFEENNDDGIDLDDMPDIVIEDNIIRNNRDDGIEIRLHEYSGPVVTYQIRRNLISGNGEDGIQIIDYPDTSDRVISIEQNVIEKTAMAAIGFMSNGNTRENYEAAPVPEPVYIVNNTMVDNYAGITGGAKVLVMNNIIVNTKYAALKGIGGLSKIMKNCLWQNGINYEDVNQDMAKQLIADPEFSDFYNLKENSSCVDSGEKSANKNFSYQVQAKYVDGDNIDLGAFELGKGQWPLSSLTN